jgi:hypothetical protein
MRIFVSYTTRDNYLNEKRLSDVCLLLNPYGYVYIDLLHNNSNDRQRRVEDELRLSTLVVFLITPAVSKSFWFMKERKLALQQKKKCFEIYIDNTVEWAVSLNKIAMDIEEQFQPTKLLQRSAKSRAR